MSHQDAVSPATPSPSALQTVQSCYGAFARGDVTAFLAHLAPAVRWRFVGPAELSYCREVRGREGVQSWLGDVIALDDILQFEPREFLASGTHVTVLGWERTVARRTAREFECEWMHVFEVKEGLITRFHGLFDSACVVATQGLSPASF